MVSVLYFYLYRIEGFISGKNFREFRGSILLCMSAKILFAKSMYVTINRELAPNENAIREMFIP